MTEGAETTPGTETKKKTTRKKSSTGTKRATVADVMKRLDTIEKNMAENAALAAESDGKVEDIYFMTSDMSGKIGMIAETPKPVTGDVPAGQEFVTSREQFNTYSKLRNRREGELANQKMLNLMMQMCNMREDFVKLCTEMEKKISKFTAKEVLESFKAYEIDMENMLLDAGVSIGPYGKDGDKIDTEGRRVCRHGRRSQELLHSQEDLRGIRVQRPCPREREGKRLQESGRGREDGLRRDKGLIRTIEGWDGK